MFLQVFENGYLTNYSMMQQRAKEQTEHIPSKVRKGTHDGTDDSIILRVQIFQRVEDGLQMPWRNTAGYSWFESKEILPNRSDEDSRLGRV